jgi:hypothetical protein
MLRLLTAALLLSGCQIFGVDSPERVELEASFDASKHAVDLRLVNRASGVVGYNLCFTSIADAETGKALPRTYYACQDYMAFLEPGQAAEATVPIPPDSTVAPGRYRATLDVERLGRTEQVATTFEVE